MTIPEVVPSSSLRLEELTFAYGRRRAPVVDRLSWRVPAGRTVLVGPNGAGKSTLLSLAADVLQPRSGDRRLGNLSPDARRGRREYRRLVGWMPQTVPALNGFTVREQVTYHGWLKGMSRKEAWASSPAALEAVGLFDLQNRRVNALSGGQLRRVGLAQTLVHRPKVMLLDEPTAGLDPQQRSRFREIMQNLDRSCSVVVSTHQIDDLGELFDNVVVMYAGKLLLETTVQEFLASGRHHESGKAAEAAYAQVLPGWEA